MLLDRAATIEAAEMLATFRVLIISGARQVGKSTLASAQLGVDAGHVFSLDDPAVLGRALSDPIGFAAALPHGSVIDEFQRAGKPLLLAIKQIVDAIPDKGQFILTGSANYLAARGTTETLAGRAGRLQLWPLSIGERLGLPEQFLGQLFDDDRNWTAATAAPDANDRAQIMTWILEGGFPEVVRDQLTPTRRARWFDAYTDDVVNREALRPIADVRYEHELRRLLRALAARIGTELVIADVARDLGLDRATVTNYVSILEAVNLLHLLPAFSTSATTAAKQRPKIHLVDSGLAAHLNGLGERDLSSLSTNRLLGPMVEQFVVTEVLKQASWSQSGVNVHHYRDREGREADIVIEDRRTGRVAAIEVKASSTPDARGARHLTYLRDRLGDRFTIGVLLHLGPQSLPLGDRLWARPISTLWTGNGQ
ncbi:MAG: ATP-binding protein [Actinomycetota bacterium]|jgi:predicted AAA+ superfamily ATPase